MTLAVEHPSEKHPALRGARRELQHFDTHRDRYDRVERVQYLTGMGMPQREVAVVVGIHERQVARDAVAPMPPQRPRLYDGAGVSDRRADELEERAELTLRLSAILREEDPTIVWGALCRLTQRQLQELTMIALAAIPIDATRRELLGWVENLSTGRQT